jgi:hypothetical protein
MSTNPNPRRKFAVFSIRKIKDGSIWVRAGTALSNLDGSFNVYLDVLPIDGQLHIREANERREPAPRAARSETVSTEPALSDTTH